jgi:unsaturated chondroitin disaccharide hydrolase
MKQFDALPVFNEKQQAIDDAVNQTRRALASLTDGWKDSASERGVYLPVGNQEWTAGFWTGELNLAYTLSGDPLFLDAVRRQIPSFLDRIVRRVDVDHHDMGFLYSPSCVAFFQETGDGMACQAALLAADNLVSRFQEKGQFIQAWGPIGDNRKNIGDR